jgi:hypothetical protein
MQHDTPEMARLFMDLWQEQMKQFMQDERYLNASLDMLQKMQQSYAPYAGDSTHAERSDIHEKPSVAPHSAAASAAHADESGKLSIIAERLSLCERRILELERQLADLERRS